MNDTRIFLCERHQIPYQKLADGIVLIQPIQECLRCGARDECFSALVSIANESGDTILDLSNIIGDLDFLIPALVRERKAVKQLHGFLALVIPNQDSRRSIARIRFHADMPVYDSLSSALLGVRSDRCSHPSHQ